MEKVKSGELKKHIEEIKEKIELNDCDIKRELEDLIKYRVPLEEAKKTVLRKNSFAGSRTKNIDEIEPNMKGINIVGRIIKTQKKEIKVNNKPLIIDVGVLGDETGFCQFTCWYKTSLVEDDYVHFKNVFTNKWDNRINVNVGKKSFIRKKSNNQFPTKQKLMNVKKKSIAEIIPDDFFATSKGIILQLFHRKFIDENGTESTYAEGFIGDNTAKLPFKSKIFNFDIGDLVYFSSAFIELDDNLPYLIFDKNTKISKIDQEKDEKLKKLRYDMVNKTHEIAQLSDLVHRIYFYDVLIEGTILYIKPESGFIRKCFECNKQLEANKCNIHGVVENYTDIYVKAVLDDGTGAINIVLDLKHLEIISDKVVTDLKVELNNDCSKDEIIRILTSNLVGINLLVNGNFVNNSYEKFLIVEGVSVPQDQTDYKLNYLYSRLSKLEGHLSDR